MPASKKRQRSDSQSCDDDNESRSESESISEQSSDEDSRSSKRRRDSKESKSHKKKKKRKHSSSKKKKKEKQKKKRRESAEVEQISALDYFRKSKEFRVWLKDEKRIFFDELSSEQSREKFRSFVKKWNRGQLDKKYYQNLQDSRMECADRTRYKWKFSAGIDNVEVGSVADRVNSWTKQETIGPVPVPGAPLDFAPAVPRETKPMVGPMLPPGLQRSVDSDDEQDRRREERYAAARKRKQQREYSNMVLDELLPKATGHEARVEKRRANAEMRRSRGESPEVSDRRLLGSGGDIHKKIAQRRQAREHAREIKQQRAVSKLEEYREKEQARMAELKAMAMANRSEGALWK